MSFIPVIFIILFCFPFFGGWGVVWGKNMNNLLLSIGDNQGDNLILVLDLSRIVGMFLLPTGFSSFMLLHSCLGDQRKP